MSAAFVLGLLLLCADASAADDTITAAKALRRQGQLVEASELLRAAYDTGAHDDETAGLLALCLLDQGRATDAEEVLNAVAVHGHRLGVAAGRLLLQRRDAESAVHALQTALALQPRSVEGLITLVTALEQLNRFTQAAVQAESLEAFMPELGRPLVARMQEQIGDRILARAARNIEALPRAVEAYLTASERAPDDKLLSAKLFLTAVRAYQLELAQSVLLQAHPLEADAPAHHLARGRLLAARGDRAGAEAALSLVLQLRPGQRDATVEFARLHSAGNEPQRALAVLAPLLDGPPDVDVLLLAGLAQERQGELPAAEAHLRQVLTLEPGHTEALYALGRLLVRSGQREEGRALLERAKASARVSLDD